MKKLSSLLVVGLCLAVSGFAQQKLGSRARLKARPKPPVPAKVAAETPPAAGIKRGAKEAVADKMVAATREDPPPPPPPPTGNVSRYGAPNQNRPPRTTRSAQPKKKSGNDLLRPNKRNRSRTNAKGKKYFLNVDANAEKQEADALGTDTVARRIEEDKRKARGRGAGRAQPNRRLKQPKVGLSSKKRAGNHNSSRSNTSSRLAKGDINKNLDRIDQLAKIIGFQKSASASCAEWTCKQWCSCYEGIRKTTLIGSSSGVNALKSLKPKKGKRKVGYTDQGATCHDFISQIDQLAKIIGFQKTAQASCADWSCQRWCSFGEAVKKITQLSAAAEK